MLSQARIHEIDRLSAKGDVEALCKNGLLHLNGNRGIDKNSQQQAIFWFTYAAKKGNTFAKGVLSLMDQKHPDNEIKMDKVIELILDLAKTKKDAASQNTLGFMYEFGVGVTKNIKEALHFYGQAADQGLADAQFTLGLLNEMGQLGLPKNGAEAHRLYGLAASQGNSYAQNNLALILERGLYGEQKDEKEAVRLFREAAKQGNSDAEANLAEILQLGLNGVEKDEKEAVRLYREAAKQGNPNAQNNLAEILENGLYGLEKKPAEALRLYELAARQRHTAAEYALASIYLDNYQNENKEQPLGAWTPLLVGNFKSEKKEDQSKLLTKAVHLYRVGVKKNYAPAQFALGLLYRHGIGVEKDAEESLRLYRLAADQGNAEAQCHLGKVYQFGLGVPLDQKEARRLYDLSARQGYPEALHHLAFMNQFSLGGLLNETEANRIYQLSKDRGYPLTVPREVEKEESTQIRRTV